MTMIFIIIRGKHHPHQQCQTQQEPDHHKEVPSWSVWTDHSMELSSYDAVLEDGSLSSCRKHCPDQTSSSVSSDCSQVRRALCPCRNPPRCHQCPTRIRTCLWTGTL